MFLSLWAGCLNAKSPTGPASVPEAAPALGPRPSVVIAHIDTGINPYHKTFRTSDPRAWQHPSTYLPGYPADAVALNLTLDGSDFATARNEDAAVWASVKEGKLYWVPGTRIVAAISFGPGGKLCPTVPVPPANQLLQGDCEDHLLLDDFGHGTMTASRMAGNTHSLAPEALVVSIEAGDVGSALDFVQNAGWIDVVSNSWGELVPTPLAQGTAHAVEAAAQKALFLFASGNGLGFINGVVGQPTEVIPTGTPSVLLVGAHDNGYLTTWHGQPVHVVADGYGGWRAAYRSLDEVAPSPESCCTSTAAPYASGGAAALVLEARKLLGDSRTGLRGEGDEGVFAEGRPGSVAEGPLADGRFTMHELKQVLEATADARPPVTNPSTDDGLIHWTATPGALPHDPWLGDNPYCVACFTTPVPLASIPAQVPLVTSIGYGAITPQSIEQGRDVLAGRISLPSRPLEDQFFAVDAAVRGLLNNP